MPLFQVGIFYVKLYLSSYYYKYMPKYLAAPQSSTSVASLSFAWQFALAEYATVRKGLLYVGVDCSCVSEMKRRNEMLWTSMNANCCVCCYL